MRMKRFLTMMLLFFFTFTMLPASKILAVTETESVNTETIVENTADTNTLTEGTTDNDKTETGVTDASALATELLDTESLLSETTVTTTTASTVGKLMIKDESGAVKSSSHYSAYQIITFDAKEVQGKTIYTNLKLNADYRAAIIASVAGLTSNSTDNQIFTAISGLTAEKTAELAIALKSAAASKSPAYTTTNGVFNSMVFGYYLVIETANNANDGTVISKPILVGIPDDISCDPIVSVKVKTSKAGVEKKIVENGSLYDSSTAAFDETINYQALSTIPTYSSDAQGITYYVTDTFSAGLSFVSSSLKAVIVKADGSVVKNLVLNTDYTVATSNISGATFRVTLTSSDNIKAWGNANYKLLLTYSAKLNDSATFGNTGNPNSINLTYSNKPGATTYTTPDDTVITYTTKLEITKTDGDNKLLSGATFELSVKNSDGTWTVIDTQTTTSDGKANFKKLEQGTYKLKETIAPSGYNLLDESIEFTVSAKNGTINIPSTNIILTYSGNANAAGNFKATWSSNNNKVSVSEGILKAGIVNTKGYTLPGTGGMGTTIFTVVGVGIILLGCSMIIVYFKRTKQLSSVK
jgi:LPXTG-motif cell wall-anchored protein